MMKLEEEIEKNNRKIIALELYEINLNSLCATIELIKRVNLDEVLDIKLKSDYYCYSMLAKKTKEELENLKKTNLILKEKLINERKL